MKNYSLSTLIVEQYTMTKTEETLFSILSETPENNRQLGKCVVNCLINGHYYSLESMLSKGYTFTPLFDDEQKQILFSLIIVWIAERAVPQKFILFLRVTNLYQALDTLYENDRTDVLKMCVQQGIDIDSYFLYKVDSFNSESSLLFSKKINFLLDIGIFPKNFYLSYLSMYNLIDLETEERLVKLGYIDKRK